MNSFVYFWFIIYLGLDLVILPEAMSQGTVWWYVGASTICFQSQSSVVNTTIIKITATIITLVLVSHFLFFFQFVKM